MKHKLTIIGIGMGHPGGLTIEGKQAILETELLLGGSRMLENIQRGEPSLYEHKKRVAVWRPEEICEEIRTEISRTDGKPLCIAVLMSGDSGFNSGTAHLLSELKKSGLSEQLTISVLPGIGAISALAAKCGIGWEEAALISLHGKTQNLFQALATYKKVFVLSGRKTTDVLTELSHSPFRDSEVFIGELMGAERERFLRFSAATDFLESEDANTPFDPMTTMLILPKCATPIRLFGMPDEAFIREADAGGNIIPMTKSEVRAQIISRLALRKNDIVFDIGAGTGSVSVEMAFQVPFGRVFSIEKNPAALAVLEKNRDKFFCRNMEIFHGEAPEILSELPMPDVAFLGGTSGRVAEILKVLREKNPHIRIVLSAIAIETVSKSLDALKELGFSQIEVTELMASRGEPHGGLHLMKAQNPVFVISAIGDGTSDVGIVDGECE